MVLPSWFYLFFYCKRKIQDITFTLKNLYWGVQIRGGGPNPRRGSKSASGFGLGDPNPLADMERGVQVRGDPNPL